MANTTNTMNESTFNETMNNFEFQDFKNFLSSDNKKNLNESDNDIGFEKKLNNLLQNAGVDLGKIISPYINGYYLIFMQTGEWGYNISINDQDQLSVLNFKDFFNARKINKNSILSDIKNPDTKKYLDANQDNEKNFDTVTIPLLATDITLPEPSKEYTNVSSRSQSITAYHKEILLPDFSISYIENQNLDVIRYHEMWHKTIELYRRGKAITIDSMQRSNDIIKSYFYSVPYVNNIWVLTLDINFQIKALMSIIGAKPVNMPLSSFLGNRSSPKMTVYNINYKASNMFYQFYKDTRDFVKKSKNSENILASNFKKFLIKSSDSQDNTKHGYLLKEAIESNWGKPADFEKIRELSSENYKNILKKYLSNIKNQTEPLTTNTNKNNDISTSSKEPSYIEVVPDIVVATNILQLSKNSDNVEVFFATDNKAFPQLSDNINTKYDIAKFMAEDPDAPNINSFDNKKDYYKKVAEKYLDKKSEKITISESLRKAIITTLEDYGREIEEIEKTKETKETENA